MSEDEEPPSGVFAWAERILGNEWTGFVAFALLLTTLHPSTWQALLAIVLFVRLTTKRPAWLIRER